MRFITYTDGGARGNPGPAGIGVVIYSLKHESIKTLKHKQSDLELVEQFGKYIGETTNNQAEYLALFEALKRCGELGATEVDCFLDSELVVKQLNREYKVKDKNIGVVFVKVWNVAMGFKKVSFTHIPREKNKLADKMVNEAIDKALFVD